MELSAQYAYRVYREKSFSAAAKALYVSQPALSSAVARLEKELGILIFDRTKVPLRLTPQGKIYIEAVEEIIESERKMRRKIHELSDMHCGTLRIGGSSFASYFLMSEICGVFHKRYPQIKMELDIGNDGSPGGLFEKLKTGEIDLLVTYVGDQDQYILEPILKERLVIAMHKDLKGAASLSHLALSHEEILTGRYEKEREIEDLSVFSHLEFLAFPEHSDTAYRTAQMLGDFKTAACEIKNSRHSEMHHNLMCAGVGAVVTTDTAIYQKQHDAENILFFMPRCKESHRTIYIARRHSTADNPLIKNFIETAKAYGRSWAKPLLS